MLKISQSSLFALGIMFMMVLMSCSAQKRYERLIRKHPELIETDTVTVIDTLIREVKVPVPEFKDSFIISHDTIIETEKLIIERRGDFFGVTVKPDTLTVRDTIRREVKVPGRIVTLKETKWTITWIISVVALIIGMMLRRK